MSETAKPRITMISPDTLKSWIEEDSAVLIDVREPPEFEGARIAGAAHNPLSNFDPAAVPIPEDKHVVLYCASGMRCGMASEMLQLSGYKGDLHRLEGGISAWYHAGNPIEQG
ncbi:MAG: rhodanese-like domain-containing protein [Rhodospirillaceae bacterium]